MGKLKAGSKSGHLTESLGWFWSEQNCAVVTPVWPMGNLRSFGGPGDWARPGNTPNQLNPSNHTHVAKIGFTSLSSVCRVSSKKKQTSCSRGKRKWNLFQVHTLIRKWKKNLLASHASGRLLVHATTNNAYSTDVCCYGPAYVSFSGSHDRMRSGSSCIGAYN